MFLLLILVFGILMIAIPVGSIIWLSTSVYGLVKWNNENAPIKYIVGIIISTVLILIVLAVALVFSKNGIRLM